MSLFKSKKQPAAAPTATANYSALAEMTLNAITDGVILIDEAGLVKFANPAAATMVGYGSPTNMIGIPYQTILRFETTEGAPVPADQNELVQAVATNQPLTTRGYVLVSAQSERKAAISLTLIPTGGPKASKIITFRDITTELEEEEKQSEFISTASHEMRTPVASIEGYLGLALNPQTATIDERAKKYLEAAHDSSQHLGRLFKDLLDVTKLDDGHLKVHEVPVEIVSVVREMANAREKDMRAKHLKYSFGTTGPITGDKQIEQLVYAAVDLDFLREILDNLIENAIKYTPEGGEIWVNARGDGDKVLINVTDTGIGVSPEDAGHIFQKFYRVDNSQTRQIGGTGLGLYLVKQRVEAMGGRVWVESSFGDGSTFFVSLPRLTDAEYQRRLLIYQNEQAAQNMRGAGGVIPVMPTVTTSTTPLALGGQTSVPVANEEKSVKIERTKPAAPAQATAPSQTPKPATPIAPASPAVAATPTTTQTSSTMAKNPAAAQAPAESNTPTMTTNTTPSQITAAPAPEQPPIPTVQALQMSPVQPTPTPSAPITQTAPGTQATPAGQIPAAPINSFPTPDNQQTINPQGAL